MSSLVVFLATLTSQLPVCKYNSSGNLLPGQDGCYYLGPVRDWIDRCIISIFLVFMIAFMPLFLQGTSLSHSIIIHVAKKSNRTR
jgi:1,3-beta-glucan synthase